MQGPVVQSMPDACLQTPVRNPHRDPINGDSLIFFILAQRSGPTVRHNDRADTKGTVGVSQLATQLLDSADVRIKRAGEKGDIHPGPRLTTLRASNFVLFTHFP